MVKFAYIIRYREGNEDKIFKGASTVMPTLYANESATHQQVNFMKTELNEALRHMGKPLISDVRIEKIRTSDVDSYSQQVKKQVAVEQYERGNGTRVSSHRRRTRRQ